MDNYAAHKRVEIRDWLAANPRIHVHFTPTSASWMNLVEVWFGIIERQAIHRGTFGNVRELTTAIKRFIAGWNDRAHPFVWTKTADQILKKANRQTTSLAALPLPGPCLALSYVLGMNGAESSATSRRRCESPWKSRRIAIQSAVLSAPRSHPAGHPAIRRPSGPVEWLLHPGPGSAGGTKAERLRLERRPGAGPPAAELGRSAACWWLGQAAASRWLEPALGWAAA